MAKTLAGAKLAGGNPERGERGEQDYYATPFHATQAILNNEYLEGSIWEPCAGEGHITKVLRDYYPDSEILSTELMDRKDLFNVYIKTGIDFLQHTPEKKYDNIITNPPFSLAQEFIEKSLKWTNKKVLMFLKIQFLEGAKRQEFFRTTPLKTVYVFSKRVAPMRNGEATDEKGKPWATTMCFAWFVWEHGYQGEPVIRWL